MEKGWTSLGPKVSSFCHLWGGKKGAALAGHTGPGVQKAEGSALCEVDGTAPAFGALHSETNLDPLLPRDLSAPPTPVHAWHVSQPDQAIPSIFQP